ncbi:hypothetical protein MMC07_007173 [Pseudocyphellaria aurata]|nr:hypothetical protein [Pseudocyphellaria aurata]
MSEKIDVIAILTPKEGKLDYVLEMLKQLAQSVHDNEPTALRYQVTREVNVQDGSEDIVMIEQYSNMAAFEQHVKTESFQELTRRAKEEDVLAKPMILKVVKPVAGFASRL